MTDMTRSEMKAAGYSKTFQDIGTGRSARVAVIVKHDGVEIYRTPACVKMREAIKMANACIEDDFNQSF